jgi:hypothetical protein
MKLTNGGEEYEDKEDFYDLFGHRTRDACYYKQSHLRPTEAEGGHANHLMRRFNRRVD